MTVTATEAKTRLGRVLDSAQRAPVTIEKNGREFAVVLAKHTFDALLAELQELRSNAETAHLLRGENGDRLRRAVRDHQSGTPMLTTTLDELEAMADDGD
ncbi:MAG: type II toxin-antitoxin system Phd/YefM family antitoxin [Bacteroidota bacterium]